MGYTDRDSSEKLVPPLLVTSGDRTNSHLLACPGLGSAESGSCDAGADYSLVGFSELGSIDGELQSILLRTWDPGGVLMAAYSAGMHGR